MEEMHNAANTKVLHRRLLLILVNHLTILTDHFFGFSTRGYGLDACLSVSDEGCFRAIVSIN